MPLYDYQCDRCQNAFEVRATFKEKEAGLKPECPRCHGRKTHQLLTAGLFVLKDGDRPSASTGGCAGCAGGSCAGCKG